MTQTNKTKSDEMKGYICISDKELKKINKESVFVLVKKEEAKKHKRFMEKNYDVHYNVLEIKVKLKEVGR